MTASLLWSPYFESSILSGEKQGFVRNEASKLGRLRRGSTWGFWFSFVGPLPVGVVFFPSLPFMGVVLSPSFVLGDVYEESGTFLVLLSLFSPLLSLPLLSLPLLSSPSPSLSFSLLFFLFFFLISFSLLPFLFLFSSSLSDAQTLSFFSSFPSRFPFLFLS